MTKRLCRGWGLSRVAGEVMSRSPMAGPKQREGRYVLYSFVVSTSQKGNIQALSVFVPHTRTEKIIGKSALFDGYAYTPVHEIGKITFQSSKQSRIKLKLRKQAAMRNGARTTFTVFIRICEQKIWQISSHLRVLCRHMTGMRVRTSEEVVCIPTDILHSRFCLSRILL